MVARSGLTKSRVCQAQTALPSCLSGSLVQMSRLYVLIRHHFRVIHLVIRVGAAHRARATHGTTHRTAHGAAHRRRVVVGAAVTAVAKVLLAESCEALLLGGGVDVGANDEANDVEEGDPEGVGEELLGKGQGDGRDDPRDLHDAKEADLDGGLDLVEGAGTSNEGHECQKDGVLDGGDLCTASALETRKKSLGQEKWRSEHTTRLLTRICISLAFRLVRPANIFWRK